MSSFSSAFGALGALGNIYQSISSFSGNQPIHLQDARFLAEGSQPALGSNPVGFLSSQVAGHSKGSAALLDARRVDNRSAPSVHSEDLPLLDLARECPTTQRQDQAAA